MSAPHGRRARSHPEAQGKVPGGGRGRKVQNVDEPASSGARVYMNGIAMGGGVLPHRALRHLNDGMNVPVRGASLYSVSRRGAAASSTGPSAPIAMPLSQRLEPPPVVGTCVGKSLVRIVLSPVETFVRRDVRTRFTVSRSGEIMFFMGLLKLRGAASATGTSGLREPSSPTSHPVRDALASRLGRSTGWAELSVSATNYQPGRARSARGVLK